MTPDEAFKLLAETSMANESEAAGSRRDPRGDRGARPAVSPDLRCRVPGAPTWSMPLGGSHAGDRLRLVDLDLAAAGHVQVRVALGQVERGVHVGGLDERVARDLAGAGGGAVRR